MAKALVLGCNLCVIFLVLIIYNRCTGPGGKYLVAENSNFLWVLKKPSLLHSLMAKMSFSF